jgi:hypothetical protein
VGKLFSMAFIDETQAAMPNYLRAFVY